MNVNLSLSFLLLFSDDQCLVISVGVSVESLLIFIITLNHLYWTICANLIFLSSINAFDDVGIQMCCFCLHDIKYLQMSAFFYVNEFHGSFINTAFCLSS